MLAKLSLWLPHQSQRSQLVGAQWLKQQGFSSRGAFFSLDSIFVHIEAIFCLPNSFSQFLLTNRQQTQLPW